MDWRLNGRNAEQNYKIIIDKGAVRTGRGWGWGCGAAGGGGLELNTSSAYPGGAVAPASPSKVFKMEGGLLCV